MFFKLKKIVHQTQIYVKLPTNPKKYWSCVWIFWWILDQLCCYYWDLSCCAAIAVAGTMWCCCWFGSDSG